jgi:hypothetical protein
MMVIKTPAARARERSPTMAVEAELVDPVISQRLKENDPSQSTLVHLLDQFPPTPTNPNPSPDLFMPTYLHPGQLWTPLSRLRIRSTAKSDPETL